MTWPAPDVQPPQPTRLGEVVWLEPYPDVLLAELATSVADPVARYEAREAISLAFITALQLLPPRQRAALILRDVLGFHASEAAQILEATEESVTSALKRARSTLQRRLRSSEHDEPAPAPNSSVERELIGKLTDAYETGDVDRIVSLLTDDVWVRMPPVPLEYQGRELAFEFLSTVAFRQSRTYKLIWTRANGQPAFGAYIKDPRSGVLHAMGLHVLTLAGDKISVLTRFDNSVLPRFGLPRILSN